MRERVMNCINQMREWKNKHDILYIDEIILHSSDLEICKHRLTESRVNYHLVVVNWPCSHQLTR
jgi:hypothetical protein